MLSNIDFGSYFHTKKYEKGLSTGGDKIADWGGSKGGWGGHVPPSLYVKRGPGKLRRDPVIAEPHNHHHQFHIRHHYELSRVLFLYYVFVCMSIDILFVE